jgi:hypothetical protein
MWSSNNRMGIAQAGVSEPSHLSRVLPSRAEFLFMTFISIALIAIGNIKSVSNLMGITANDRQDIGGFIGGGFTFLNDKIQSIPFGETAVVFVINFIIALIIINAITYAMNEYKSFRADIYSINTTPEAIFLSRKKFAKKLLKNYAQRTYMGGFGIIWLVLFFLLILPMSIRLSSLYLHNLSNLSHLIYLILAFIVVMIGLAAWLMYFKILFNNKLFNQ